jgi:hypothetical protein
MMSRSRIVSVRQLDPTVAKDTSSNIAVMAYSNSARGRPGEQPVAETTGVRSSSTTE